jgi:hypothetical protein
VQGTPEIPSFLYTYCLQSSEKNLGRVTELGPLKAPKNNVFSVIARIVQEWTNSWESIMPTWCFNSALSRKSHLTIHSLYHSPRGSCKFSKSLIFRLLVRRFLCAVSKISVWVTFGKKNVRPLLSCQCQRH